MITARRWSILAAVGAFALAGTALGQSPNPNTSSQATEPSNASSPHQRDVTGIAAPEARPQENPNPTGAASPHQREVTRMASAAGGNIAPGMAVQDRSGRSLGEVSNVVTSGGKQFVVVAGSGGTETPVPYRAAQRMIEGSKMIIDRQQFENAPKSKQSELENQGKSAWERRTEQYWQKPAE